MTLASPKFRRPRKPYRPRKTAPRYLLSCACSLLGNSVASVVLPLVLLATTGDALAAGTLALICAAPQFVIGLVGGALTDRFNRMDREKFGEVDGVTDHDFYTNSFHYPVWLQPTPMEKLDYEKDFPYYASGGFINYCEFPCLQANPKALEAVWDYAYTIGIGYLGTNTPIDRCYECGFEGDFEPTEEGFKCPECGNSDPDRCNVTKRTCGYLGNPVQRPMVHGRHEEIAHRVKHMSGETGHVTLDDGSEREWFEEAK